MNPSQLSSSLTTTKVKVVLLGDSGVGKSSIIDRFVKDEIDSEVQPTIGIDFLNRKISYAGQNYRLQLWDTAGQQKYRSLVPAYLKDANCCLMVFDISRGQTFESLSSWLTLFKQNCTRKASILLVANKSDLCQLNNSQQAQQIQQFRDQEGLDIIETSAREGINIEAIFEQVIQKFRLQNAPKEQLDPIEEQEDAKAQNFVLKYNEARFEHQNKRFFCCHI